MTKVEAIRHVLEDNHGVATWEIIYGQIARYYPEAQRSQEWKAGIRGVLYREIRNGRSFKMLDTGVVSLFDYDERNQVLDEDKPSVTTKDILLSIRIGQERFRKKLLLSLSSCPITGIDDARLLNASHIKPWAVCDNAERLDVRNGFILSPTVDMLFDKGLITFEDNKRMLIAKSLSKKNIEHLGPEHGRAYPRLPVQCRELFLQFHRDYIFDKK